MQDQAHAIMEDKLTFLFQPDTLLPTQYFSRLRSRSSLEPEKALMLAVLEDAISCFKDNVSAENGNKKLLFNEAEEWILQKGTDWIFSFDNICEVFELNPQYVRHALRSWKDQRDEPRLNRNAREKRQVTG